MHTAVVTTIQHSLPLPHTAKVAGSLQQRTASLPMAHTVGGWVESNDAELSTSVLSAPVREHAIGASLAEPRHIHRTTAALLRSLNTTPLDTTEGDYYSLVLPGAQLRFECVQAPAALAMAQIFDGHHRIAEVMRRQGCEGRWQISINRHYRDEEPVEELLHCMNTLTLRAASTGVLQSCPKGVSVVVTRYQPASAERIHCRSVLPLYDINTQRPKSLIMSGALSLHIEGPFFHRYEPMEALLASMAGRSQKTVLVMGNDEPGEYNDIRRQMQVLLEGAPDTIGGVVLLQAGGSIRRSASVAGVYTRNGVDIPELSALAALVKN